MATIDDRPLDRLVDGDSDPEDSPLVGRLGGTTRRTFIRGIAAAGAGTMAAATGLAQIPGTSLFGTDEAQAHGSRRRRRAAFGRFTALGPGTEDRFEVPPGFRADVLISWGDTFLGAGETLEFGFNNDFLAFFPLRDCEEGILFVNHEYPDPFFQHGFKAPTRCAPSRRPRCRSSRTPSATPSCTSSATATAPGRSISPSRYNRRIYGDRPASSSPARAPGAGTPTSGPPPTARWATAPAASRRGAPRSPARRTSTATGGPPRRPPGAYGWAQFGGGPEDAEYDAEGFKKYGWVCEHDPYDPDLVGRKHTALGRFRHENTAFRHEPGKRFVLYMGDDKANEGVYKFVSDRRLRKRDREEQPQDPRGGHPLHRALGARGPPALHHGGRHRADHATGAGHLGAGAQRPRSTTRPPSCASSSATSTTSTSPPTAPRTSRWRPTAASTSRSPTTPR